MSKEIKTYSSKATAIRGAKRAGVKSTTVSQLSNGRWIVGEPLSPLYNAELRVKSEVKSPCALVWELCFKHPTAKRRDVVSMAIEAGVSRNTAQSNYQAWRKASGLVKSPKLA